jgi:hypothetical protein
VQRLWHKTALNACEHSQISIQWRIDKLLRYGIYPTRHKNMMRNRIFWQCIQGRPQNWAKYLSMLLTGIRVEHQHRWQVCHIFSTLSLMSNCPSTITSTLVLDFFENSTLRLIYSRKTCKQISPSAHKTSTYLTLHLRERSPALDSQLIPFSNQHWIQTNPPGLGAGLGFPCDYFKWWFV